MQMHGMGMHADSKVVKNSGKFEDSSVFLDLPEDNSMSHKSDRAELLASSLHGCLSCTWLLQSLNSRSMRANTHGIEQWLKRPATIERDSIRSFLSNRCTNHYRLTLRCPAKQPKPYQPLRGDELATLLIDALPSSTTSQRLLNTLMNLEQQTPSSATWKLFDLWLGECVEGHPECEGDVANKSRYAPAHLIDIQSADRVRLVETSTLAGGGENGSSKYATLSHCWGTIHEPQLNESTAQTLKEGFSLEQLPRLYYDAVILARYLKIPYLWIDSLCILQDSKEDWQRESAKMGAIYENSYLCIAASAAADNSSGFLEKHSADWPQPLVHGNLVMCADLDMKETNLNMSQPGWCNRMRTLCEWGVDNAPLNKRAWVLQERMFAPRILHCSSDEFVWECRRGMRSESHAMLTSGGSVVKDVWKEIHQAPAIVKQPLSRHTPPDKMRPYLERWSQIIGHFTSLNITSRQDRLPAVSAIAKKLQPILGAYTAGLWEGYMPSQLLWRHRCYFEAREKRPSLQQNRSPSWSWSSLDCQTVLPYYMDEKSANFPCAESRHTESLVDLDTVTYVRIFGVDVRLSGDDVTGAVEGGLVHLAGPLFPMYRSAAFYGYLLSTEPLPLPVANPNMNIRWDWDDVDSHGFEQDALLRREILTSTENRPDSWDNRVLDYQRLLTIHSPILTNMCCLPVVLGRSSNGFMTDVLVRGLVLEVVEDAVGVYRRIGYFECTQGTFEAFTKSKPEAAIPLTAQWPSRLEYSPKTGFTIDII
ncbi:Fc.00g014700.m01.CDS01 [Cosmosporella sp. VM-42]